MGLSSWLKRLGLSDDHSELGLLRLGDPAEIDAAMAASGQAPLLIYKHSPVCGTSAFAFRAIIRFLESCAEGTRPTVYFVDVVNARSTSNEAAARLGVAHQSPQLILVHKGKAVWHASHGSIREDAIQQALDRDDIDHS